MLSQVLSPLTEEEFFRDYWGRKFLYLPGSPEKFSGFFNWDVLNRTLEQHRFTPGRLKLAKGGEELPPARFLNGPFVNASRLVDELSNGASLVLNECEDVHPPLREFCIELERLFHVRVSTNLYAGWRENNGFDVHWDDQDVIILQVAGPKHWKVWNPTRLHPFRKDLVDTSLRTRPAGDPIWEAALQPGEFLYIPRGWWHLVNPVNEPCLHLTVTIANLTGIDFLEWFRERMKASVNARMDLPVVAPREERRRWLEAVKRDLDAIWSENLIEEFMRENDGNAVARPQLSLPSVALSNQALMAGKPMQLAVARPLHFLVGDGTARFAANGCEWEVKPYVAEKLERFNDFAPHTLAELAPDFRVVGIVMALLNSGILRIAG